MSQDIFIWIRYLCKYTYINQYFSKKNTMYLQRTKYLSQILPYLGKPVIKVLTGMRRSGKSILLEQIIQGQRQEDILSLHREWPEYHGILSDSELTPLLERAISAGKRIICIDEVQLIHHWERSVNAVYAKYRDIDIILTGSNSDLLSGELATLLSGRYIEFQVFPFSFSEYCEFHHISL